jgi:hypothetical protein
MINQYFSFRFYSHTNNAWSISPDRDSPGPPAIPMTSCCLMCLCLWKREIVCVCVCVCARERALVFFGSRSIWSQNVVSKIDIVSWSWHGLKYCVLCTVYCILCTVYCVLCTVYCVQYIVYCILCTVYTHRHVVLHTHTDAHSHARLHTHVHTHMHVCTHTLTHAHTCMHTVGGSTYRSKYKQKSTHI